MEKDHNVKADIKVVITDTDTGEVIAPKEKPISPFFKVPWGWVFISFIALLILNVKYGKLIFGLAVATPALGRRGNVGQSVPYGVFLFYTYSRENLADFAQFGGNLLSFSFYRFVIRKFYLNLQYETTNLQS